jgi:hypothetical protein
MVGQVKFSETNWASVAPPISTLRWAVSQDG